MMTRDSSCQICRRCGNRFKLAGRSGPHPEAHTALVIYHGLNSPRSAHLCQDCTELIYGFIADVPEAVPH
jgi:hypothetical protein